MTNKFEAEVAADLFKKINNNKEGLSWKEANEFRTRVTSNLADIEIYLTTESNRLDEELKKLGTPQTTNNFKDSLAEITKFKTALQKNAQYLDTIKLERASEKDQIIAMIKGKIGELKAEVAATTPAIAATAAPTTAAPAPAVTATVAPETKDTAPTIKAFIERIKNGKLNPVQRVKPDIGNIEKLLAKGEIAKLPKGVDLAKITTWDLQRALKVGADGELGPVTINALLEIMDVKEMYDAKPFVGTKKMKNKSSSNQTPTRKEQIRKADQEKDEKVTPAEDIGWDTFRTANQTKAYNEEIKKAEQAKAEEIKKPELLEVEELRKAVQSSDPTPSIV